LSAAAPDLLLTHGYFLEEDPKEKLIMKPYAPLGILYISAWLRRAGMAVEIFDSTFRKTSELEARLRQGPPSVVGFYANLMTRSNVVRLMGVAKEAGWRVVAGGPEPASYEDEYLAGGADVIVTGEGETTMEELVPVLGRHGADPERLARIAGISFRGADSKVVRTPERTKIADIDLIPWPDRESVDIRKYVDTWRQAHGTGSISIITARGCPYKCNWCSHGVYGFSHRRRSVRSVVDEVEFLMGEYRPDMLWIADDVFTIKPAWLFDYAAEMKRRGLRIPFECITRADRMNEEVARTLAELGCFRVWIGSESGSQRILDAMQRGVTVGEVREAIALARRYGIETGMFLMWGYEGEEVEDIEATVEHVKASNPDIFFTTISYPIKGTGYFERVAARVRSDVSWENGSDRDFQIQGRHSRRYYDFASRYLRREVELSRLLRDSRRGRKIFEIGRAFVSSKVARIGLAVTDYEVEA